MTTSPISTHPQVSQFVGVTSDHTLDFGAKGKFRVLVYAAYSAHGLIGPEKNGIAIIALEGEGGRVVVDEIEIAPSGYNGPSAQQIFKFGEILSMKWPEFQNMVNESDRCRFNI
jgi:hypothetical protein